MKIKIFNKHISRQRGFLAILAVFLILVIGALGVTASFMFVGNASSQGNMQQSENAINIAESGLESSARAVSTSLLTGSAKRIACASVTGNANLTATTFGSGAFTATTVNSSPIYVNTTLNGALTATATTVPVASTTGLSPAGTVMIDLEVLSYASISGNSLIGVERGFHYSYPSSHATGTGVAQYECDFDVVAGVPNVTSPNAKIELREDIAQQEGWVAGSLTGNTFVFTRWNRPTELVWTASNVTVGTKENLNSIFMLSNAEGWAVGAMNGTAYTILHYKAGTWAATALTASCNTQTLNDVTAVSSQEAYAVGNGWDSIICALGNQNYTILKWNGSSWTALSTSTTPSIPSATLSDANLNGVQVIGNAGNATGNFGFAVGDGGIILQFNGSTWTKITSPTTKNLEGVNVVSATEAWAVGVGGVIIKWNGTAWATVTSPTTTQLNSIQMLDATQAGTAQSGWAVGNAGVAITYNGSTWSSQNTGNSNALNDVDMFNTNDVWAAAAAGTLLHWDGTAWTSFASGETVALNSIALVHRQRFPTGWQQIFP